MQLLALAAVHFLIDLFASMLPAILPAIRMEFEFRLSLGVILLGTLTMTSNGIQPLTGHLRAGKRNPMFLHLGLILGAGICLLDAVPRGDGAFAVMILLAVVSGFGIAIVHPEGLRAVHRLRRIRPAVSTAVFMAGGFLGYASGGAVSALLVSRFGLRGLYPLALCPVIGIVLIGWLRVRLAVEPKVQAKDRARTERNQLSFWLILAMAIPAAISTTVLASLLPTVLNELGFDLTFGGFSTTMFGLGGAIGSFVWADIAHKKGEFKCIVASLFLVIPFLAAYLMLINNKMAIWMLFGAGFFAVSAYILMITLSRQATGLTLGHRMGFMVGGTWAVASVFFMALSPAIEHFGADVILKFSPLGYLCSGAFGLLVMLKAQSSAWAKLSAR
jgi:MFS family permease